MYAKYFKRILDVILSLLALVVLSPLFVLLMVVGVVAMGGNPFFVQPRPGKKDKLGNEKIFNLIKFRTMNNKKDKNGNLLPDEQRLTKYGRFLRSTSLDEFPEAINILKGDMSVVGPRPLAVKYLPYYNAYESRRHDVLPGLTGLAQINGRNTLDWKDRFTYDINYVDNISFWGDVCIILKTVMKMVKRSDIAVRGTGKMIDFDEYRRLELEKSKEGEYML